MNLVLVKLGTCSKNYQRRH